MRKAIALVGLMACATVQTAPKLSADHLALFRCDPVAFQQEWAANKGAPISVGMPLCTALARLDEPYAINVKMDGTYLNTVSMRVAGLALVAGQVPGETLWTIRGIIQ